MSKLDSIKTLYKPYKYTIKGSSTIVESTNGSFVIKKKPKDKDLVGVFNYLKSRGYANFPSILYDDRDEEYVYEYIDEINLLNPQLNDDLINLVALLHAKTSYNKEVTEDNYKEIYENIKNNILYLKDYYFKYFEMFLKSVYPSPKEYLLLRNYSKINASLLFSESELDKWYDLVKEKKNERISYIHNNLSIDHFIKGERDYLISWDKSKFDTPILDLYNLYLNNCWDLEFNTLYKQYININRLSEEEEKLFFVLISLPPKIEFEDNEFISCKKIREKLDYIYKTEEFLKPYYSTNAEN